MVLLKSVESLKQLYAMSMDVHQRFRTESHQVFVGSFLFPFRLKNKARLLNSSHSLIPPRFTRTLCVVSMNDLSCHWLRANMPSSWMTSLTSCLSRQRYTIFIVIDLELLWFEYRSSPPLIITLD